MNKAWIFPVLVVGLISPFTPGLDLWITHAFYNDGFVDNGFTRWMFDYGEWIGFFTGGIVGGVFLLGFIHQKWKKAQRSALVILLTLVLGAGLITNVLLKGYWGRPRPKQVVEFGGKHAFRPFYRPNFHTRHDPQKSFPSGHAAMGFYYLAFVAVGRRYRSLWLTMCGIVATLFFGVGLSAVRIVQGGHFFSDTLYAFLVMWLVVCITERICITSVEGRGLALQKSPTRSDISQAPPL